MDEQALAGVRAIVARNDALAREELGVLFAGLQRQHARRGGQGDSRRWIAIVQLFEDEGRKFIRATSDDLRQLDLTVTAFPILEVAFRDFISMMEQRYFDLGKKAAPFGGSRPIVQGGDKTSHGSAGVLLSAAE